MTIDVHSRLRYYSGDFMNAKGRERERENLRRDNVQLSRQRVIAGRYLRWLEGNLTVLETSGHPVAAQSIVLFLRAELAFSATRDSVQSRCVRACRVYRSLWRKFFHSYTPRDIAAYIPNRERGWGPRPFPTTIAILIFFYASRSISRRSFIASQRRKRRGKFTCAYTTVTYTHTHTWHALRPPPSLPVLHVSPHTSNRSSQLFLISIFFFSYTHLSIQARVFNDMTMTVIWHDTIWYDMIMRWLMWPWPWFLTMIFIFTYLLHVVWCVSVSSMRRSQTPWSSTFRKSAPISWTNEGFDECPRDSF